MSGIFHVGWGFSCLRYLDMYSTVTPEPAVRRRTISDDLTVYEDNVGEDEIDLGVMNGSADEEKAKLHADRNTSKKDEKAIDESQFFFTKPLTVEDKPVFPVASTKQVAPCRHEPSVSSYTLRSDPEGVSMSSNLTSPNDSSPSINPDGSFGMPNFSNLSKKNWQGKDDRALGKPEKQVSTSRMKDPDAINLAIQRNIYPINKKEKLDDVQGTQMKRMASNSTLSTKQSNLSPLVEGNAEDISPNTEETSSRSNGGGRRAPTLRHDLRQSQPQEEQLDRPRLTIQRTSSKKSGGSTRSSRSHSRENVPSSYPVASKGRNRSKQSWHRTPPQDKTEPSVSAHSGSQRYHRASSGAHSKSPKTFSSSGSNPPPTISDGMSSKEGLPDDSKHLNGYNEDVDEHVVSYNGIRKI